MLVLTNIYFRGSSTSQGKVGNSTLLGKKVPVIEGILDILQNLQTVREVHG